MNRILLMALIIIYLCSGVLPLSAQQNSTLKDAVRDQYLEKIDEDGLSQIENSANLSSLDPYSHFLTEKELVDVSELAAFQPFALPISDRILYLRIPVFHAKTAYQVHQALTIALQNTKFKAVIIDLRGNKGGLLNAAIEVADEFIKEGKLASTKGRQDISNLIFLGKSAGLAEELKVAVIIDKNTASAAELLAGILRINAAAPLIGQNSYGKSAVQSQIHLQSGGQLKLTTAYYYFSDGSTVSQTGLIPNVQISPWQLWRYPPLINALAKQPEDLLNPLLKKAINSISLE
ncbi:MAG: hypothetical protein KA365_04700 [Arenimonas sp.]|nr:hypothetical protein [Arenimonas sp.]